MHGLLMEIKSCFYNMKNNNNKYLIALTLFSLVNITIHASTWTIMNYGHADHNLSLKYITDMLEMQKVGSDENFRIINQVDVNTKHRTKNLWKIKYNIDPKKFDGVKRILINKNTGKKFKSTIVESLPEDLNMDNPQTLTDFINWTVSKYPADRYGLILWNHGGQFVGFGGDTQNNKKEYNYGLTTNDIKNSIKTSLIKNKIDKLEFISFDSCLMGGVEVLYDFHELCEVYFACPELDYGGGWDYDNSFNYLKNNPDIDIFEFAKKEIEFWDVHHNDGLDKFLKTHVAYNTKFYPNFINEFENFSNRLRNLEQSEIDQITIHRLKATSYSLNSRSEKKRYTNYIDLGDFLERILTSDLNIEFINISKKLLSSIDDLIIGSSLGTEKQNAKGLSIAYPYDMEKWNNVYSEIYKNINISKNIPHWSNFIHGENKVIEDNIAPYIYSGSYSSQFEAFFGEPVELIQKATLSDPAVLDIVCWGKDVDQFTFTLAYEDTSDPDFIVYDVITETGRFKTEGEGQYNYWWPGTVPTMLTEDTISSGDNPFVVPSFSFNENNNIFMSHFDYFPPDTDESYEIILIVEYDEGGFGQLISIMEVTGDGENEAFADSDIELEAGGKLMPVYTSYKFDKEGNYVEWEYFIFEDYSMTVPDDGAGGIYFEFNTFSGHMDDPDESFLLMAEANDINGNFSDVRAYHVIVEDDNQEVDDSEYLSYLEKSENKSILQELYVYKDINSDLIISWDNYEGVTPELQFSDDNIEDWKTIEKQFIKKEDGYFIHKVDKNNIKYYRLIYNDER